jgi:hypothetical protein
MHNKKIHDLYSSPSIIINHQYEEDEMDRVCSMNGGRGMHIGYCWERERDHWEDQDISK